MNRGSVLRLLGKLAGGGTIDFFSPTIYLYLYITTNGKEKRFFYDNSILPRVTTSLIVDDLFSRLVTSNPLLQSALLFGYTLFCPKFYYNVMNPEPSIYDWQFVRNMYEAYEDGNHNDLMNVFLKHAKYGLAAVATKTVVEQTSNLLSWALEKSECSDQDLTILMDD